MLVACNFRLRLSLASVYFLNVLSNSTCISIIIIDITYLLYRLLKCSKELEATIKQLIQNVGCLHFILMFNEGIGRKLPQNNKLKMGFLEKKYEVPSE